MRFLDLLWSLFSKKPTARRRETSPYAVSRTVVVRSMGDDLVVVNEAAGKLAVLNATARQILDGILAGDSDAEIALNLRSTLEVDGKTSLVDEIERTRKSLIDVGLLVTRRTFEPPTITVRDLKTALKDMDLSRATVSQYE